VYSYYEVMMVILKSVAEFSLPYTQQNIFYNKMKSPDPMIHHSHFLHPK